MKWQTDAFEVLGRIRDMFALDGVLIRKNGEKKIVKAAREKDVPHGLGQTHPTYKNAFVPHNIRTQDYAPGYITQLIWSTNDIDLKPDDGDFFEVVNEEGNVERHKIIRSALTGNFWDWKFTEHTGAIVFYTRLHTGK